VRDASLRSVSRRAVAMLCASLAINSTGSPKGVSRTCWRDVLPHVPNLFSQRIGGTGDDWPDQGHVFELLWHDSAQPGELRQSGSRSAPSSRPRGSAFWREVLPHFPYLSLKATGWCVVIGVWS
jgi:hypothetical protein